MKNKKHILILITILSLTYIGLFIYYIESNNDDVKVNIKSEKLDNVMTVEKVLSFIESNKIDYLDTINKSFTNEDITNQSKLRYVYLAIKDEVDFYKGVSFTRFSSYIKSVFGSNISIKNENILNSDKNILLQYDEVNEVYRYGNEINEFDYMQSYYNYVVDFQTIDNNYILTVNKFFVVDDHVYASIDDAKAEKNMLFVINDINKTNYIKQYVTKNYNTIKDYLHVYKYSFVKEKGNIILKKYEKVQNDDKNI